MIDRSKLPREVRRWLFGWKILSVSKTGKRFSRLHWLPSRVEYPARTVVRRPKDCGPLGVFREYSDAFVELPPTPEGFGAYDVSHYIIVPCLWKPSRAIHFWYPHDVPEVRKRISFWSGFAPRGTALAEAIYCLT